MKKFLWLVILGLIFSLSASAQIEFNDSSDIQFRTGLDMNSNSITDLPSPSGQTDDWAATKGYVDNNAGGGSQALSEVLAVNNTGNQSIKVRKSSSGHPVLDYRLQEGDDYGAYLQYDSQFGGDTSDNRLVIGTEDSGNNYEVISAERAGSWVKIHRNTNLDGNKISNVSKLNVSDTNSNTKIAVFDTVGSTLNQPLSIDSPGPLSVANGVDLTDSVSNTIDSYSTMYLETSSGIPSDIVLNPTGDTGIQSNLSITGAFVTGGNHQSGLTTGDINVSTIYYDSQVAKSPVVSCSKGTNWCEVTEPERQLHYFVKKDESFDKNRPRETAKEIIENDIKTAQKIQKLKEENNRQEEKIEDLQKTVKGLKAALCTGNSDIDVC